MSNEVWKPLVGYEGDYEISEYGVIKRLPKWCGKIYIEGCIKAVKIKHGYPSVKLNKGGRKYYYVHRLVALTFLSDTKERYPCVNHKDGNKVNSHYSNLEWCTSYENTIHAFANGLRKPAKKGGRKVPVENKLTGEKFKSLRLAHESYKKYHLVYFCDMLSGRKRNVTPFERI